jgi:alpha-ribazole phosphatase
MLILLRHGQTDANARALLQGRIDLPLDDTGRLQAEKCGAHIRDRFPGARVIASPLLRARETAAYVDDSFVIDDRFVELDYGAWDGVALTDVPREDWTRWREDPSFRPPGGESLVELDARVRPALEELVHEARESHVVVVSHVSPIKSAITWALGVGPDATWRCHLDRASICRISIGPRGPSLTAMNETAHLLD